MSRLCESVWELNLFLFGFQRFPVFGCSDFDIPLYFFPLSDERMLKSEISNLQVEKSLLESRVSGLLSTRAGEKATLSSLEKKLADERKQKTEFQVK